MGFADVTTVNRRTVILSSDRVLEIDIEVDADSISPDSIAAVTAKATACLLRQATDRSVALDWSSWTAHYNGDTFIGRVDVL